MSDQGEDGVESNSIEYGRSALLRGFARISADLSQDWSKRTPAQRAQLHFLMQRFEILLSFVLDGISIELNIAQPIDYIPVDSLVNEAVWLAQSLAKRERSVRVESEGLLEVTVTGERTRIASTIAVHVAQSLFRYDHVDIQIRNDHNEDRGSLRVALEAGSVLREISDEDRSFIVMIDNYLELLLTRLGCEIVKGQLVIPFGIVDRPLPSPLIERPFSVLSCIAGVEDLPEEVSVIYPHTAEQNQADVLLLDHKAIDPLNARKKTEENIGLLARWNKLPSILVTDRLDYSEYLVYRELVSTILVEPVSHHTWRRYAGSLLLVDRRGAGRIAEIH